MLAVASLAACSGGSGNPVAPFIGSGATIPTATPSGAPTVAPTATPSTAPTGTAKPTATPTIAPTIVPTATPTVSATSTPTVKPTATPSVAPTATPTVTPSPAPTTFLHLIVANSQSDTLEAFPGSPIGTLNEAPITTVTGSFTGLFSPAGIAVDASGKIYVADGESNAIEVYAANPQGITDASPIATIEGVTSGLATPYGIALDKSGKIYVANSYVGGTNSITVYAANPSGIMNEAPIATIQGGNTGLRQPEGLALDASGHIYVDNLQTSTILVFAANPSGTLNEAPIATIGGSNTGITDAEGVAIDPQGKLYVANTYATPPSITVYAANANPSGTLDEAPIATISGSNTGLAQPSFFAFDTSGRIYVTNQTPPSITVYAANPTGALNEVPLSTISGSNTGLEFPSGIVVR